MGGVVPRPPPKVGSTGLRAGKCAEKGDFMAAKKDLTIDEKALKEFRRLKRIFKDLPKDTLCIVLPIIRNVAFMTVTLDDLQDTINKDGVVVEYQNGENQWGTKKSPEVDVYNTMIKNYNTTVKQLAEFLPKGSDDDEANDIMKFAMKTRK